jgi:uncharacterized membrane protein required for colicin V production
LNWIDLMPIVLVVVYAVGGILSGAIRRFIGLVALFVAMWAATSMGIQAGGILQQTSNFETPDARIYGFFGIVVALLLIVEVATQLAHSQIQIPAITLNRTLGAALGVLTALLLSVVVTVELEGAAQPEGDTHLDALQISIRDAVNGSSWAVKTVNVFERPVVAVFGPFLPSEPGVYFGRGPVS